MYPYCIFYFSLAQIAIDITIYRWIQFHFGVQPQGPAWIYTYFLVSWRLQVLLLTSCSHLLLHRYHLLWRCRDVWIYQRTLASLLRIYRLIFSFLFVILIYAYTLLMCEPTISTCLASSVVISCHYSIRDHSPLSFSSIIIWIRAISSATLKSVKRFPSCQSTPKSGWSSAGLIARSMTIMNN